MSDIAVREKSESELIQWLKDFSDNLNTPRLPLPRLKTFSLEIPYDEVFVRDGRVEVRQYIVREIIQAQNREKAATQLYSNVSKSCEDARCRKDIRSYHVFSQDVRTWDRTVNPNQFPDYKVIRTYPDHFSS